MRDPVLIGAEDARAAAASLSRSVGELRSQVGYLDEVCQRRLEQLNEASTILEGHVEKLRAVIEDNTQTLSDAQCEAIYTRLEEAEFTGFSVADIRLFARIIDEVRRCY